MSITQALLIGRGTAERFNAWNSGTQSIANAATVSLALNTGDVHYSAFDGAENVRPVDTGWFAYFGTVTLSSWSSTIAAGQVYRSISFASSVLETTGAIRVEEFQVGNHEHSIAVGGLQYVTGPAGTAQTRGTMYQDSNATRTAIAGGTRYGGALLPGDFAARAVRTSAQALTAGVEAVMTMNSEIRDSEGLYSAGSPDRVTIPTGGDGWYLISGCVHFPTGSTTHIECRASLQLDGTTRLATHNTNAYSGTKNPDPFALYYLTASQYVWVLGLSGGAVSTTNVNGPHTSIALARIHADDLPGACVSRTTAQTITANSNAAVVFNSAVRDTWGMSDIGGANPSRLTVPVGQGGWYMCVGNVWWATLLSGVRYCGIYKNGQTQWEARASTNAAANAVNDDPAVSVGMVLLLNEGDYMELKLDSTVNCDTQADQVFLALVKLP